jgi:hypothetical protein
MADSWLEGFGTGAGVVQHAESAAASDAERRWRKKQFEEQLSERQEDQAAARQAHREKLDQQKKENFEAEVESARKAGHESFEEQLQGRKLGEEERHNVASEKILAAAHNPELAQRHADARSLYDKLSRDEMAGLELSPENKIRKEKAAVYLGESSASMVIPTPAASSPKPASQGINIPGWNAIKSAGSAALRAFSPMGGIRDVPEEERPPAASGWNWKDVPR